MKRRYALILTTALIALAGGTSLLAGGPGNGKGNPNPGIVPSHAVYKGKTAGEWTAAWWQWVRGTEGSVQMYDETGEFAYVNNNGADGVFFLAKSWAEDEDRNNIPQERHVTIPTGTPLYIPVMGFGSYNPPGSLLEFFGTFEAMREAVNELIPSSRDLSVTINGESVAALEDGNLYYLNYVGDRLEPSLVENAEGEVFEVTGYEISVILKPLPPGEYVIEMKGKFDPDFESDVTYYLTVEPGN